MESMPANKVAGASTPASNSPVIAPPETSVADSLLIGCRRTNWDMDPDMTIFFRGKEQSPGAEEFRSLRSRLYRVRKQQNLKTILVTSALSGEGRSFVAVNLAQVLAFQAGCRVLLIDGDLRNPRLHLAFGTTAEPGFSEYLLQEAEEFGIIQRGRTDSLFLIPRDAPCKGRPNSSQTAVSVPHRSAGIVVRLDRSRLAGRRSQTLMQVCWLTVAMACCSWFALTRPHSTLCERQGEDFGESLS